MKSFRTPARPRSWATRTSASIAALAFGAVGLVGFASAASAAHGDCVPADAVTHDEHTYTKTSTQWAAGSPGGSWAPTGNQTVVVDSPAVTHVELEYRKWSNGQSEYNYQWFRQDSPPPANSGWELSGVSTVVVDTPAVTHIEYEYSLTESTGWLTESPGSGWIVADTRTVTDTEAVVCDDPTPTLTASAFQFRPGDRVDLDAIDFLPGEDVRFVLNSTPMLLGLGLANQLGTAQVSSLVIPLNAVPGVHTIVATGLSSARTASTQIEVLPAASDPAVPADTTTGTTQAAAPPAIAAATLAETGTESLLLLGLAGSLALAGAGLIGLRRTPARI